MRGSSDVQIQYIDTVHNRGFVLQTDPFGGDPFKENDPFKTSPTEDFFRKPPKADPFASPDPFSKSATLPSKVSWKGYLRIYFEAVVEELSGQRLSSLDGINTPF